MALCDANPAYDDRDGQRGHPVLGQLQPEGDVAFFPVLGVLVILRTSMQAMGQKLAPVLSSITELFLRFLGGVWMIPTFGYPGGAWNTPITWCAMTAYIFTVYWFKTRRVLREPSAVACEEARS